MGRNPEFADESSNLLAPTSSSLLAPTNDFVFKRLFVGAPELLVSLINDLRPDLPDITEVDILNPTIDPSELTGKHIVLDVLAKDKDGHCYNVEIQVNRYDAWNKRGLFYLARTLSRQLAAGEAYEELGAVVGLHLLDFELFQATAKERSQAIWRFEMRDERQSEVTLGNTLQLNLIELPKADRLARMEGDAGTQQTSNAIPEPLKAWITFFKHWREEAMMSEIAHEPVQKAMNRIRELSADEEARRLAFVRERALHDGATLMHEARQRGLKEGLEKGVKKERHDKLLRLLERRFGPLDASLLNRLQQADADTLDRWFDMALDADEPSDIFD